jgi:hypothetical protein
MAMIDAGYDVVLATPDGSKPHIDPASDSAQHLGGDEQAYRRARTFFDSSAPMNNVRTLRSVADKGLDDYAASSSGCILQKVISGGHLRRGATDARAFENRDEHRLLA